jgi:DNA polymerase III sliding clamp (beta) subunit (PCNA family)
MKIEVAKSDLATALAVTGLAVEASGSRPIMQHYTFRVKGEAVQVLSVGERVFAASPLIAKFEGEEGAAFTVEAWRLDKWVNGVSDGVLKLSADGGGDVSASGPRSKVRFRSLDPKDFPFWDGLEAKAQNIGSIDPRLLSRALGVSRWFVSADDTSKPELCQVEARDGTLWATDRRALSSVEVPALPGLNIRIPGKDVAAVVRFLNEKSTVEGGLVSVRFAERSSEEGGGGHCTFLRSDGAYLGVARPSADFPVLRVDRNEKSQAQFVLDCEEFNRAIAVLSAGAPKGHQSVTFSQSEGVISLSMPCEAGGEDEYPLALAKLKEGSNWEASFTVDYHYIKGIADTFGLDTIEFGASKKGSGGYISFKQNEEGGNNYYTVIVWRS